MQAVILAGGRGVRMASLTENLPKPLLNIGPKNLLEYKLDILPAKIKEVVIVIGYEGKQIESYFGHLYKNKKIKYVWAEPNGTGFALWQAKSVLHGNFLVMCGDDLYAKKDIEQCIKHKRAALVFKSTKERGGGRVILDANECIKEIKEGVHPAGSTIATGLYVLDDDVFKLPLVSAGNGKNEFGLPQTLMQMKNSGIKIVYATAWHQVTAPDDLNLSEEERELFC